MKYLATAPGPSCLQHTHILLIDCLFLQIQDVPHVFWALACSFFNAFLFALEDVLKHLQFEVQLGDSNTVVMLIFYFSWWL